MYQTAPQFGPVRDRLITLEEKYTYVGKQYTELQTKYAALTASLSTLQSEYQASQQENASLKSQIATLQSQIQRLNNQIKTLDAELASANKTISSLKSQIANDTATITSLRSTVSSLESKLSNLRSLLSSLETKIKSLESTISKLESELAQYKDMALRIIASPTQSATHGYAPLTVRFDAGLSSNPLQIPSNGILGETMGEGIFGGMIINRFRALIHRNGNIGEVSTGRGGSTGTASGGSVTGQTTNKYTAIFTESGLPPGESYSVTFNGKEYTAKSPSRISETVSASQPESVVAHAKAFQFSVTPPSGYTANPSSGYIYINPNGTTKLNIIFTKSTTTVAPPPPPQYVSSVTVTPKTPPPTQSPPPLSAKFLWGFGDGSTSADERPSHTYANPGTYQPFVTITIVKGKFTYVKTFILDLITVVQKEVATLVPNSIVITGPTEMCPTSTGTWTGTVYDKSGTPVPNALVDVSYSIYGIKHRVGILETNADGQVSIQINGSVAFAGVVYAPMTIRMTAVKFGLVKASYGVTLSSIYCL